jgi:IS5 family transposase
MAIARACIRNGARGRFFNVVDLVNKLEAEGRAGRQGRMADYLSRMDFIILDELGYLPMLERHIALYGEPPRQLAADGGYASRDNLRQAKAQGVRDMAFHKKRGLRIEDMVRSRWVYRQLRNFRAGIEADISCLKRAYGLARCTWRGLGHFKAYVWSSVVAYNLALLARLKPA